MCMREDLSKQKRFRCKVRVRGRWTSFMLCKEIKNAIENWGTIPGEAGWKQPLPPSGCRMGKSQCSSEYLPIPRDSRCRTFVAHLHTRHIQHDRAVRAKLLSFSALSTQPWVSQGLLHFSCAFLALGWQH